jgi:hypothetical protein
MDDTEKLPWICPAAIVMNAGSVTAAWLSERLTRVPPVGAGLLRTTVALEVLPPTTLEGLRTKL